MNQIWLAFITGLTTGGLSCLAVQGGLLASSVSPSSAEAMGGQARFQKITSFLVAKLAAYTLLGFGLGSLGSTLILTPKILGFMQIFAGLFMLATAGRLLNIHPIFRYFVIEPPKLVLRIVKHESKKKSLFAPAILGFLTVFIPCGVTQAMMALSVASANPFFGAGIMFAFTLGTSPIFFAIGVATTELLKRKWFSWGAATAIIGLGFLSINTGQVLRGSPHTAQNYWIASKSLFGEEVRIGKVAGISNGRQNVTINVERSSYTTSASTLKAGVPVNLSLVTKNVRGCTRAFTIPSLGISKILPETGEEKLEFTPNKPGHLAFTCSTGMYSGLFNVVQ